MNLPSQAGRVALVTGANTGIGEVTARELARAGAKVYLACRSQQKAEEAMERVRADIPSADLHFLELNLGSLASVRAAASAFLATGDPLHLLINNAGIAANGGVTDDGFESTFGVNHLGHFLLTLSLLDRVVTSGNARVVTVASKAHYSAKGIDWDALRKPAGGPIGMSAYNESKLANILFISELDRRLSGTDVRTFALHPGVIASDIWGRSWAGSIIGFFAPLFMISTEEGAKTTLHCATDPAAADHSGLYWDTCAPKKPSRPARDQALAAELWRRSLEWTGATDWNQP